MALTSSEHGSDPSATQNAQETAVGITAFVARNAPGFRCTVKQRYTDFLVNEILPSGEVLHLSELTVAPGQKRKREDGEAVPAKKQKAEDITQSAEGAPDPIQSNGAAVPASEAPALSEEASKAAAISRISAADQATLDDVFGKETVSSIFDLYASVLVHPERKPRSHPTVISKPFIEKQKRTEAHMCVRRIFESKLETVTNQDQASSAAGSTISITAAPKKIQSQSNQNRDGRSSDGQPGKQNWSDLGGDYLHFTLYKENKDTMEVLYFLGSQLKMHMKHFSFAGTKDRRGVTVQRVAIYHVRRERMQHLNRLARGWRLGGPWEYRPDSLDLGMLTGNEFLLTLRDVHFDGEDPGWDMHTRLQHAAKTAAVSAKSLSNSGFLNYYGLQRFGSYSTGTHVVGMRMLKGDLKGAIDAIMAYDPALLEVDTALPESERKKIPHDDIARAVGIAAFDKTGDSREALASIPTRFSAERSLVTHLGKSDRKSGEHPNKNDFQGGLMSIQRNLRLMYVHAYQSFIWNTVAAKRWETIGNRVVEGDLVVIGEKEPIVGANGHAAARVKQDVDENGEPVIHPSGSADSNVEGGAITNGFDDPYVRARPLSKEEAESGHYNVFDLVLPLPGYDVLYPSNAIGAFYQNFMSSDDGGNLDPHNMRRAWKDVSLSGGYRKMMARPLGLGVEVSVKPYSAIDEQMVQTDLEKLEADGTNSSGQHHAPEGGEAVKDKIAIVLKMQLGSSQYATMALRELTKGGAVGYRPDFSAANR